ncbi:hypothetical protein FCM35_KLT21186 [Carex littledalei]|uniref:Uncharacterized protein n=1 Tax=Carex littledalei TaxID=544730 RepID=A0A833RAT7_9POAL|nr:hypothetical protein FCM35_KLT21186 [Carex littledalei]
MGAFHKGFLLLLLLLLRSYTTRSASAHESTDRLINGWRDRSIDKEGQDQEGPEREGERSVSVSPSLSSPRKRAAGEKSAVSIQRFQVSNTQPFFLEPLIDTQIRCGS